MKRMRKKTTMKRKKRTTTMRRRAVVMRRRKKAKIESDEDEDSEDEDSEEDDSEEDGGDELPNFDDIDTKDLTEAQKKKLEMVKKMFAAAQEKVAKEADTFEKNKAANAKKKVGDVNDNVKQK